MDETVRFDVVMVGPFPSDPQRIEGGIHASIWGLATSLLGDERIRSLAVLGVPHRPTRGIVRTRVGGIDVTFLDTPGSLLFSTVLRVPVIARAIDRLDQPLVHIHGSGIVNALTLLLCRLKKIPVVWTLHGITEKELYEARRRDGGFKAWARWLLYTGCERLQLRFSPHVIVDTPYVAAEVTGRIHATPMTIPQGIFPEEMAGAVNPDRSEPVVVALGVIHPRKGHDLTIRAFARVVAAVPEARLIVVGALADPAELDRLRLTVAELGLGDRVDIRVGVPRDGVLSALAEARVFALHSQEESQGIALCEAMAAGLPIVATRVGGIPDVVGTGGAGFLVDYGDVDAMAGHIVRLLCDDELFRTTAEAARRRAGEFAWTAIADRVLDVYRAAHAALRRA